MADKGTLGIGFHFDDLAVGDTFRSTHRTLFEADLAAFCNLTWLTEELFTRATGREEMALPERVVPAALVYSFAEGLLLPMMQHTGLAFLEAELRVRAPTRVGDTIGFVGATGWATGPHLHYEFRVNNQHRNPLTLAMPAAEPVPAERMPAFAATARPLAAQLELLADVRLAALE